VLNEFVRVFYEILESHTNTSGVEAMSLEVGFSGAMAPGGFAVSMSLSALTRRIE
jgi:hypothetical protein